MSSLEEFTRLNTRKASIVHIGGLSPTNDVFASNFGLKSPSLLGEEWPVSKDQGQPQDVETSGPGLAMLLANLSDHVNRTFRLHRNGFGNAPQEQPVKPSPAVRADHDQAGAPLHSLIQDDLLRTVD